MPILHILTDDDSNRRHTFNSSKGDSWFETEHALYVESDGLLRRFPWAHVIQTTEDIVTVEQPELEDFGNDPEPAVEIIDIRARLLERSE